MITLNLRDPISRILGGDPGPHRIFLFAKSCINCPSFPSGGRATCRKCLDYIKAHKESTDRLGLCVCKRPLAPGLKRCIECRTKYNKSTREKTKQKIEAKICMRCTVPVETGLVCPACIKRQRKSGKKATKKRKQAGICLNCPNKAVEKIIFDPETDETTIKVLCYCAECAVRKRKIRQDWDADGSKQRKYSKKRRTKFLKKGLCGRCGTPAAANKTRCEECLIQNRIITAIAKLKKKPKPQVSRIRGQQPLDRMVALLLGKQ